MPEQTSPIAVPNQEYILMAKRWQLIHDLLGGTQTMREAGQKWLPKEQKETPKDYESRLSKSFLYPLYANTIETVSAHPFTKSITVDPEDNIRAIHPELGSVLDNADGEGSELSLIAQELFRDGLVYGKFHALVDFPNKQDLGINNLADQRAVRPRPTIIPISPSNLIGWRSTKSPSGGNVLTQIRIKQWVAKDSGEYGTVYVEQIKLYTPTTWEVWQLLDKDTWSKVDEGVNGLGKIPLVTGYFNRSGFMVATPTYEDLAYVNLTHWQSYSDHRHLLRFTRTGVWKVTGVSQDEFNRMGGLVLGLNQSFLITAPEGNLEVVEPQGHAIEASERDIKDLEDKAKALGVAPMVETRSTATEASIDNSRNTSDISHWVRVTENAIEEILLLCAEWLDTSLPEDFSVSIYSDFSAFLLRNSDISSLLEAESRGIISKEDMLNEMKRRGLISDNVKYAGVPNSE